jgi:hypothetical protein
MADEAFRPAGVTEQLQQKKDRKKQAAAASA